MPNNFEASHEACQPKETQKPSIGLHGGEMTVQHMGGGQNYGPFILRTQKSKKGPYFGELPICST